jgi:hypothetical protein
MGRCERNAYHQLVHDDDDNRVAQTDMLLVIPGPAQVGEAGEHAYPVLRRRGEMVEAGVIRELESGKPIHGQVVRLERRTEHPLLFNVETMVEGAVTNGSGGAARSGPAQVASEEYRAHWDAIFGQADTKTDALN